jgi:excisionase family DNA binding protein
MDSLAYTIAEAAKLLGVHRSSLYRRVVAGEIRVLRGLGVTRIPAAEIDRFLAATKIYEPKKRT